DGDRRAALALSRSLAAAARAVADGARAASAILAAAHAVLVAELAVRIDYVELRDASELTEVDHLERPAVLAVAAFLGKTRLIDNRVLEV
ncbi:MAG: pantoate--beta-alanine ligase, partial [Proteobacteria bacterium]|nr:pantoate--beta-alanine ligase [Pseudomonadota bacterium]